MKGTRKSSESSRSGKRRPAQTPEAREKQMIALAVDAAEKQLREGTASPSVIVHYLKLGTSSYELEKSKLEEENKLLKAKTEALQSAKQTEELYREAINAFKIYSGANDDN